MSDECVAIVRRARALIGVRFRFQGRDPEFGLDCVGLAASAYLIPAGEIRRDYSPRAEDPAEVEQCLAGRFTRIRHPDSRCGDLMLCAVRAHRLHFAIHCGETFVHADARLRRVVEVPGAPPWPVIAAFRPIPIQTS